jgi:hypothetical protein
MGRNDKCAQLAIFSLPTFGLVGREGNIRLVVCELLFATPMNSLAVDFEKGLAGLEQAVALLHKKCFVGHFDLCDTALFAVLNGCSNDRTGIPSFVNGNVKVFVVIVVDFAKVFDLLGMSAYCLRLGIHLFLCPCRPDLGSSPFQSADKCRKRGPRDYLCSP